MVSLSSCLVEEKVSSACGEGKEKDKLQSNNQKITKYVGGVTKDSGAEQESSLG